MGDRSTETNEETCSQKHLKLGTGALECNTDEADTASDDDSPASPKAIGNVWRDWEGQDATNGHDGGEKTKMRALGMVEIWTGVRQDPRQFMLGLTHILAMVSGTGAH